MDMVKRAIISTGSSILSSIVLSTLYHNSSLTTPTTQIQPPNTQQRQGQGQKQGQERKEEEMLQTYLLPPPNQPLTLPPTTTSATSTSNNANPPLFNAAMTVRIAVFVHEQHVPLHNELDDDDRRSWHWIIFDPSPSTPSSTLAPTTITITEGVSGEKETEAQAEGNQGNRRGRGNPIAVLRLVPPPHPPHETFSHPDTAASLSLPRYDLRSEPCVRVTRVAVLPSYRGLGLGRELVERAVAWAGGHVDEVQGVYEETLREVGEVEGSGEGGDRGKRRFNGLVLAHAQTSVEGMYKRLGFECDEGLGRWDEEGIEHVGMMLRVPVSSQ